MRARKWIGRNFIATLFICTLTLILLIGLASIL